MLQEAMPRTIENDQLVGPYEGIVPEISMPEETTAKTPEAYHAGLGEQDRRLVDTEAAATVKRYRECISFVEQQAESVEGRPARLAEASERLSASAVERIAADSHALGIQEGTPLSNGIKHVSKLDGTLKLLRSGVSLSDLPLKDLGVALPKVALSKKKREAAEASLSEQLQRARNHVLDRAGISSIESVTQNFILENIVDDLVTGGTVKYVAEGHEELDIPVVSHLDERLAVLVATGQLDETQLRDRLQKMIATRFTTKTERLQQTLPSLEKLEVNEDATLAGHVARGEILKQGLDSMLLAAFERYGVVLGHSKDELYDKATSLRTHWAERAQHAEQKFARTVLRGDTILEHYTPLALNVITAGGLHPKARHGYTAKNNHSQQVHFTSDNGTRRVGAIDYVRYADVSSKIWAAMNRSIEVRPVSGMFAAPLAELVEGGMNRAIFTTKETPKGNAVEDIVLATADGAGADFPIDKLDLVVMRPEGQHGDLRLPYEAAIEAEMVALRGIFAQRRGQIGWSDLLAQHLNYGQLARDVLKREGADRKWVDRHVFDSFDAVRAKHSRTTTNRVVVPLALPRSQSELSTEHVDGDSHTLQGVYLGVVRLG